MGLVFDLILLMASGAATVYCFVLSRRLSKLNDTKNGLGASIASMSHALDQTQQMLTFARASSIDAIQKLAIALEEAERVRPEIVELIDEFSALAEIAVEDIDHAKAMALVSIENKLGDVEKRIVTPTPGAVVKALRPAATKKVA